MSDNFFQCMIGSSNVKLYHGDCLDIMKDIPDDSVDAVITDPPYGIDYQSNWSDNPKQKIINDKNPFIWFLYDAFRITKNNGCIAVFCRWDVQHKFTSAIECAGFDVKNVLVWDRVIHGMGDLRGNFAPQHEVIIFATKGRFIINGNRPKSVLRSKRINGINLIHPNEKPVDLMEQLIIPLTKENDYVLDCFMGAGSTGVSCINTNRNFIGIEKDANFFSFAKNRIESLNILLNHLFSR